MYVCEESSLKGVCLGGVQKQHVKALAWPCVCLRGTLAELYFVGNECVFVLFVYIVQTCLSDSVCYCQGYLYNSSV